MGRYCSYLLPKQAGALPKFKTLRMTSRPALYLTRLPEEGVEDALRHDGLAARGAAGSERRDEARLARPGRVWEAGEERDDGTLTLRHLIFSFSRSARV